MTTSSEAGVLDTNVLIAAFDTRDPNHEACRRLVEAVETGSVRGYVVAQVLFEFVAVVTNPKRVRSPRSVEEALRLAEQIADVLPVLPAPVDLHARVIGLYRLLPSRSARNIFDTAIAATALGNGIGSIFTYNMQDFEDLPGIIVLTP